MNVIQRRFRTVITFGSRNCVLFLLVTVSSKIVLIPPLISRYTSGWLKNCRREPASKWWSGDYEVSRDESRWWHFHFWFRTSGLFRCGLLPHLRSGLVTESFSGVSWRTFKHTSFPLASTSSSTHLVTSSISRRAGCRRSSELVWGRSRSCPNQCGSNKNQTGRSRCEEIARRGRNGGGGDPVHSDIHKLPPPPPPLHIPVIVSPRPAVHSRNGLMDLWRP